MLKKWYNTEKILLIAALFLFACILFFNAFYKPEAAIPSVIYVSEEEEKTREEADKQNIQDSKININTATEDELSDIKNVSGIGEKMFEKIKNAMCM